MEPSSYVYQVPGDAWLHILQAIGFLGIFALGVIVISSMVGYWSYRSAAVAATRCQSGNEVVDVKNDLLYGFGLDDFHIDEGIDELEKLANNER